MARRSGMANYRFSVLKMPELPEVETTRRGLAPYVEGRKVTGVVVRERRQCWPVPDDQGQVLRCV